MNEQIISGSGRKKQEVYGSVTTTIDTTGLATSAKQDTQTTELTSIKTAVETLDNAISGTEMQVDVVAALPAGTNNIGDVDMFSNTVKDGSGTRYQPLVDADGHLQVDVLSTTGGGLTDAELRATPVPVSGTVTANLAAGTNNIGDVDVLSSALPTGASTLAEQQTQTTALQLIDDTVYTDGAGTVTKGIAILGQDGTNPQAIKTDASGELQVDVLTMPTTTVTGTIAVTQSGTWDEVGINDSGNSITIDAPVGTPAFVRLSDGASAISTLPVSLASVPSHAVTNAGTFAVQVDGSALTALQLIDDTVFTDDAAFTVGTSKVNAVGMMADETSPDSVDEGDIGIPRMTLDRKQIVTAYPSSTTGDGLSVANFNSGDTFTALTNSAQVIKASAGNFYGYYIYNPNSAATYVMLYNTAAASVTVGTTTPAMVFCIPATSGANLSLNYPITFSNAGWSIAAATTGGGNSAPATALEAMIFYK